MRLIIGRDFAVTRSSPESCCDLFAIASEQTLELKWLSASWFLVSMYLIWILGSKLIRSNNSVGPGHMSHCETPSLDNHLNYCFVVLKHISQSFLMRKWDV